MNEVTLNDKTIDTYNRILDNSDVFDDPEDYEEFKEFDIRLYYSYCEIEKGALRCSLYDRAWGSGHANIIYGIPIDSDVDTSRLYYGNSGVHVDVDESFNCINPTKAKSDIQKYLSMRVNDLAIKSMIKFRRYSTHTDTGRGDPIKPPAKPYVRSEVTKDLKQHIPSKFKITDIMLRENSMLKRGDLKSGNVHEGDSLWYDCKVELPNGTTGYYTADFVYEDGEWVYHTNKFDDNSGTTSSIVDLLSELEI